jgi:hypothetical protein
MPDGPFAGQMLWRGVRDFEHASLSRAFGLDPVRFYFDVASSARGIGSNRGGHSDSRRQIDGFVFMSGRQEPVARLRVVRQDEKLWDGNPLSRRDAETLDRVW